MTVGLPAESRILVTGADGFIGRNLTLRLRESGGYQIFSFRRGHDIQTLHAAVVEADAIVHLAGENRPSDPDLFDVNNAQLTDALCNAVRARRARIPLIFASSTQAALDNPYGRSKRVAEHHIEALAKDTGNPSVIFRLPGVFGKWCKPHYNSVVATFCHNVARELPLEIHDPARELSLVHVDDVVAAIINAVDHPPEEGLQRRETSPVYRVTLGGLAEQLQSFRDSRQTLVTDRVGAGFTRALYATYVSYLPMDKFAYTVPKHQDPRGVFVEMLRTPDCGQLSFFTMTPGATRGSHYHHSKTEKFLVVRGSARMRFRHLLTDETFCIDLTDASPTIVDTIPGWVHDITNTADGETVVMLWANELFDKERPDTVFGRV